MVSPASAWPIQKLHNKVNITANVRFDIVIFQPDTTRKRKEKGVI